MANFGSIGVSPNEPNWPVLLFASELAVFAVTTAIKSAQEKKFGSTLEFLTFAAVLLAISVTAGSGAAMSLHFVPQAPPLTPYVLLTFATGVLYAVETELIFDLSTRRRAFALAPKLDDFARECLATKSKSPLTAERQPREEIQQLKYIELFGAEIIQVDRGFIKRGFSYRGLIDSYLGAREDRTLTTWDRAVLTSKFMLNYGSSFPAPRKWSVTAIFKRLALYIAAASAVWLLLFALAQIES